MYEKCFSQSFWVCKRKSDWMFGIYSVHLSGPFAAPLKIRSEMLQLWVTNDPQYVTIPLFSLLYLFKYMYTSIKQTDAKWFNRNQQNLLANLWTLLSPNDPLGLIIASIKFVEELKITEEDFADLREGTLCRRGHTGDTKSFADGTWCTARPSQSHPLYKQLWACVATSWCWGQSDRHQLT